MFTILYCGYFFASRITTWEALDDESSLHSQIHESCASRDENVLRGIGNVLLHTDEGISGDTIVHSQRFVLFTLSHFIYDIKSEDHLPIT